MLKHANMKPSGMEANISGIIRRKLDTKGRKLMPVFQNSLNLPACSG